VRPPVTDPTDHAAQGARVDGKGDVVSRAELEEFMKRVVPVAERLLETDGDFHPFAAAMSGTGEIVLLGPRDEGERESAAGLIQGLVTRLRAGVEEQGFRATALLLDVRVVPPEATEESDAIRAVLEHVNGAKLDVFIPYRIEDDGKVEYGRLFAVEGISLVFASDPEVGTGR
jgi:hypothetical protein